MRYVLILSDEEPNISDSSRRAPTVESRNPAKASSEVAAIQMSEGASTALPAHYLFS